MNKYQSIHGNKDPNEDCEETWRISMNLTKMKLTEEQAVELIDKITEIVEDYITKAHQRSK